MPSRLSGKQRASRIPLDYYKTRDGLTRWKLRLSGLALLVAAGWWLSGLSFGGPGLVGQSASGRMRYSHGPLTRAHAMWDSKCDACHIAFRPIGQEVWTKTLGISAEASDAKCQSCHQVEGHHENMKGEEGSCASCHRDHKGRDQSLVDLPDADCTSCHAGLSRHVAAQSARNDHEDGSHLANAITAFPATHDEFHLMRSGAKAATDPGTLKFNHALHLSPGLNDAKDGRPVFTVAQLTSPADREKYGRGLSASDPVTLNCASCHRLENGDLPALANRAGVDALAAHPVEGKGAYMRPISYRTDCAACHKLDVTVPLVPGGDEKATATLAVAHRLQPIELHEMLRNASIGLSLGKDPKTLEAARDHVRERPLPGRREQEELSAVAEVDARVTAAERKLFGFGKGTCTECHQYKTPAGIRAQIESPIRLAGVQIEPTYVPTIWYERALFDHSAHRAVSCRDCHEGAYPDAKSPSKASSDVLLPGKVTCAQCHAPESTGPDGRHLGGAGHACTECHRYHGGDFKPGPAMAKDRDAMSIQQFLLGTPGGKAKGGTE